MGWNTDVLWLHLKIYRRRIKWFVRRLLLRPKGVKGEKSMTEELQPIDDAGVPAPDPVVEPKKWWTSKTLWGIVISSILSVYTITQGLLGVFGVHLPKLPDGLSDQIVNIVLGIFGVIGSVAAVIGRFVAKQPLTK